MTKRKPIPWLEIKAEYLNGCSPKELSKKYNVPAKTIHEKASKESWVDEKASICKNLQDKVANRIQRVTELALERLECVLTDDCIKNSDLVNAIGKAFDISGLKSSKQEITGKDGSPIIQQNYVMPAECEDAIKHIKDFINND